MEIPANQRDTRICGSLEIWRIWRVCVTHSLTLEMETRLCKVSRAMSSVFSCLHRANETLCARCAAYYRPLDCKLWFCTGPNNRLSSRSTLNGAKRMWSLNKGKFFSDVGTFTECFGAPIFHLNTAYWGNFPHANSTFFCIILQSLLLFFQ